MPNIVEIADLKRLAKRRVPKMFFDYADSGAWTESTYRANETDFAKIKLRQRVLVDMTNRSNIHMFFGTFEFFFCHVVTVLKGVITF